MSQTKILGCTSRSGWNNNQNEKMKILGIFMNGSLNNHISVIFTNFRIWISVLSLVHTLPNDNLHLPTFIHVSCVMQLLNLIVHVSVLRKIILILSIICFDCFLSCYRAPRVTTLVMISWPWPPCALCFLSW